MQNEKHSENCIEYLSVVFSQTSHLWNVKEGNVKEN